MKVNGSLQLLLLNSIFSSGRLCSLIYTINFFNFKNDNSMSSTTINNLVYYIKCIIHFANITVQYKHIKNQ
jgi:hypothetical protein